MLGVIITVAAGILISLQAVFNTRLSEKIGLWETNIIVHGTGLVVALTILLLAGSGSFRKIGEVNKFYLLGGTFGVIIVYSVMRGISALGATYCIAILLVAQLIMATIIDTFGLFGSPTIKFDYTKPLGVAIMIVGIIIFKLRG